MWALSTAVVVGWWLALGVLQTARGSKAVMVRAVSSEGYGVGWCARARSRIVGHGAHAWPMYYHLHDGLTVNAKPERASISGSSSGLKRVMMQVFLGGRTVA